MDTKAEAILAIAAHNFVRSERRDRFTHEAKKKPGKLMARVCHDIESLFEERFKNGSCSFLGSNGCLLFTLVGHMTFTTWDEAMKTVERGGGGGYLIIDESGRHFFAQAEGSPPPVKFAGDA